MSATVLRFAPKPCQRPPLARLRLVAEIARRLGAEWAGRHGPLADAALDMLQVGEAEFAERCRLIAAEPGALVRVVDHLSRLAGHMIDVGNALASAAQRIREHGRLT